MPLDLLNLQQLWGPPTNAITGSGDPDGFTAISTDSRSLIPGSLFVPLIGERFDGHTFLQQAIEAGCAAILITRGHLTSEALSAISRQAEAAHCAIWMVEDTLQAYQQLALCWRQRLGTPVVAVTGSAGKTSTRELIRAALAPLGSVLASSGNENNDIGVPRTLLRAGGEHSAVVVEMGMRGPGEIERLSLCARPDVAVITNIGTAHIGRLGSREAIAEAKCEIVAGLDPQGLVVIPAGDPLLEATLARVWNGAVARVALAGDAGELDADWRGALDEDLATIHVAGVALPMPLAGRHQGRNLLLALAVSSRLGLKPSSWQPLQVDLPGGRSGRLEIAGVQVLDETYNASPEAVMASLELLAGQPSGQRFAVLGTMLELGANSVELHAAVARRCVALGLDGLLLLVPGAEGEAMAQEAGSLPALVQLTAPEQAAAWLADQLHPGDTVLLKASRGVALERAIPVLQQLLNGQERS
jgi:UDP-N-acetylmuramoyl-tripeptide--D-alanyl-D-alanine ligase